MKAEWQPIETAPKDGTEIIILLHGCAVQAVWGCIDSGDFESGQEAAYWWESSFDLDDDGTDPTHWMSLPDLPREKVEGGWTATDPVAFDSRYLESLGKEMETIINIPEIVVKVDKENQ